jgi:hypothetical protein
MQYGIDLRDALWGAVRRTPTDSHGWIGVRRLRSLIDGLRPDGAFARSVSPESVQFREGTAEFTALLVELIDSHRLDFIQVNSDSKKFDRPQALKLPRPWQHEEANIQTGADLYVFIKRLGAGG